MSNPAVEAEKQVQFERDKAAFDSLGPGHQRLAASAAAAGIYTRKGIVWTGEAILGVSEIAFNLAFRWPLMLAWRGAGFLAEKSVQGVKLGVGAVAGAGRAGVALEKGALALAGRAAGFLSRRGMMPQEKKDAFDQKIAARQERLSNERDGIAGWSGRVREKIDRTWNAAKENIRGGLRKTAEFLEYYGAIGLYRGAKWILDPRTPSGKPLLGNEKVNKTAGVIAAAGIFAVLAFEFSKLLIIGKLWHYKLAHLFFTSHKSLKFRLLQQTFLQPAITTSLASLKFVTLPIIAATRQTMKSTPFTQAIAYKYNARLRARAEKKALKQKSRQQAAPAAADGPAQTPEERKAHSRMQRFCNYLRHQSFGFIRTFIRHVIEKSSPEFYEVRYRHYQEKFEAARAAATAVPAAAAQNAQNDNAPRFGQGLDLGADFAKANTPQAPAEPKGDAPEPKNSPPKLG